jgi:hypothetical protein
MSDTVVRAGDPADTVQKTLRSAKRTVAIIYLWLAAIGAYIIWKGGLIGLIVVAVVVAISAIWMRVEGAIESLRMRRLMQSGTFTLPAKNAPPLTGSVDAWLLLAGGFKAAAVDRTEGALWFFPSRKRVYRFDLGAFRRIERGVRKTWYGGTVDILRLSDQYAGPSLDFVVREGDILDFLRAAQQHASA